MIYITIEQILTKICCFFIFLSTISYWGYLFHKDIFFSLDKIGKGCMVLVFISLTVFLVNRWFYSKHLPLSNLYESLMFLSWLLSLIHLVVDLKNKMNWLGSTIAPSVLIIQIYATLFIPKDMQGAAILVPALQSQWLMMHVSLMLLSYATLLCGSLLSLTLLVLIFWRYKNIVESKASNFFYMQKDIYTGIENNSENRVFSLSINFRKFVLIQQLDQWSSRIINLGFICLTVGILSGAVWANETWGSFWNWDPKETWALITWIIYAIYLHTRINNGWRRKESAIVACSGFFSVWICYLGVNLLGIGLHTYGWLV
uniref:cytochrome c heme attachment protein n=1 Tax=Equisetum variegatum TaxID=231678 RepID=UPI0030FEA8F6